MLEEILLISTANQNIYIKRQIDHTDEIIISFTYSLYYIRELVNFIYIQIQECYICEHVTIQKTLLVYSWNFSSVHFWVHIIAMCKEGMSWLKKTKIQKYECKQAE